MALPAVMLHDAAVAGFVVLGGLSFRAWLRSRTRANATVAAAFGSLGLLAIAWFAGDLTDYGNRVVSELSVVVFLASGYGLSAMRHALVPASGRVRRATIGAMAAVATLHAATGPPLGLHPRYSVL